MSDQKPFSLVINSQPNILEALFKTRYQDGAGVLTPKIVKKWVNIRSTFPHRLNSFCLDNPYLPERKDHVSSSQTLKTERVTVKEVPAPKPKRQVSETQSPLMVVAVQPKRPSISGSLEVEKLVPSFSEEELGDSNLLQRRRNLIPYQSLSKNLINSLGVKHFDSVLKMTKNVTQSFCATTRANKEKQSMTVDQRKGSTSITPRRELIAPLILRMQPQKASPYQSELPVPKKEERKEEKEEQRPR